MEPQPPRVPDRRHVRRRQYNRRQGEEPLTAPPYYETFLRIAEALEGIEELLRGGRATVVMPDVEPEDDRPVARPTAGPPLQER